MDASECWPSHQSPIKMAHCPPNFIIPSSKTLFFHCSCCSFSMAGFSGKGGSRRNQMWMVQGSDARLDAFSKRRFSLFKKVIELCTLCAVENALVVLSIGGKAFVFGPRGVDPLRYGLPGKPDFGAINHAEDEEEANLHRLIKEYTDELLKLKAKNIRTERLKQKWMESLSQGKGLVDRPIDGLSFEELLILNAEMEEIEKKLKKRMKELSAKPAASTPTSSAGETNASLRASTENEPSADVNEQ